MEPERGLAGARHAPGRALPRSFFARDTLVVARDLIGCLFCRRETDGTWSVGRIVETEAYVGESDPACHASSGLTPRTRVMFGPPGRAYVYFTYGMHHLVNFVTEPAGFPAAVLVRAVRPEHGIRRMRRRRRRRELRELTSGPSRLCQALGIDLELNETPLQGPVLMVKRDGNPPPPLASGPRVGIRKGVDRPWRFWADGDPFVSRGGGRGRATAVRQP